MKQTRKDGPPKGVFGIKGRPPAGLKTGHYKELPCCAADGKTYKEALANVGIIIQEWIETAKELGRPILAPRGHFAFA